MTDVAFAEFAFAALCTIRSLLGMRAILEQIGFALLSMSKYLFYNNFLI